MWKPTLMSQGLEDEGLANSKLLWASECLPFSRGCTLKPVCLWLHIPCLLCCSTDPQQQSSQRLKIVYKFNMKKVLWRWVKCANCWGTSGEQTQNCWVWIGCWLRKLSRSNKTKENVWLFFLYLICIKLLCLDKKTSRSLVQPQLLCDWFRAQQGAENKRSPIKRDTVWFPWTHLFWPWLGVCRHCLHSLMIKAAEHCACSVAERSGNPIFSVCDIVLIQMEGKIFTTLIPLYLFLLSKIQMWESPQMWLLLMLPWEHALIGN